MKIPLVLKSAKKSRNGYNRYSRQRTHDHSAKASFYFRGHHYGPKGRGYKGREKYYDRHFNDV